MMEWPQKIMLVLIDGELYGFPLQAIRRILHAPTCNVFSVAVNLPSLYGYSFMEDELIPLIDARILLTKLPGDITIESSILVIDTGSIHLGLLVDRVISVVMPVPVLFTLPTPLLLEARDYFAGMFLNVGQMVLLFSPITLFRGGDVALMVETGKTIRRNIATLNDQQRPTED